MDRGKEEEVAAALAGIGVVTEKEDPALKVGAAQLGRRPHAMQGDQRLRHSGGRAGASNKRGAPAVMAQIGTPFSPALQARLAYGMFDTRGK